MDRSNKQTNKPSLPPINQVKSQKQKISKQKPQEISNKLPDIFGSKINAIETVTVQSNKRGKVLLVVPGMFKSVHQQNMEQTPREKSKNLYIMFSDLKFSQKLTKPNIILKIEENRQYFENNHQAFVQSLQKTLYQLSNPKNYKTITKADSEFIISNLYGEIFNINCLLQQNGKINQDLFWTDDREDSGGKMNILTAIATSENLLASLYNFINNSQNSSEFKANFVRSIFEQHDGLNYNMLSEAFYSNNSKPTAIINTLSLLNFIPNPEERLDIIINLISIKPLQGIIKNGEKIEDNHTNKNSIFDQIFHYYSLKNSVFENPSKEEIKKYIKDIFSKNNSSSEKTQKNLHKNTSQSFLRTNILLTELNKIIGAHEELITKEISEESVKPSLTIGAIASSQISAEATNSKGIDHKKTSPNKNPKNNVR